MMVINERYADSVVKQMKERAPTKGNIQKGKKRLLIIAIATMIPAIVFIVIALVKTVEFAGIAIPLAGVGISSFIGFLRLNKLKDAGFESAQEAIDNYRDPEFGTVEDIQKIVDEVAQSGTFIDDNIALNAHYLIRRKDLTDIVRLESVVGVSTIAVNDHNGGYERYLIVIDKNAVQHSYIYYKNAIKKMEAAMDAMAPYCPQAMLMMNPKKNSKHLPDSLVSYCEKRYVNTQTTQE